MSPVRNASDQLYNGCRTRGCSFRQGPCRLREDGNCKVFVSTKFININHVCLQLYAQTRRLNGRPFKLKTVALSNARHWRPWRQLQAARLRPRSEWA